MSCLICKDEGWVCENHPEIAWNGGEQECCGGAGSPCKCNTSNPPWSNFTEIISTNETEH